MKRLEDTLREIAGEHDGLFTAGEASDNGIAPALVVQLRHRGRIERLAQGLYRFPSWPTVEMQQYHEATLWPQAHRRLAYALISHESALEIYKLSTVSPSVVHVTLPARTRIRRSPPTWLRLHFAEVAESDRRFERGVPIVSIPRAIEDAAKTRDSAIIHEAVFDARERRLLREDETQRLVERFGEQILRPFLG